MVDRSEEVVNAGRLGQLTDERAEFRTDPFAFEADEDVDLGGVFGLEALGFEEVGFVAGHERGQRGVGVGGELGVLVGCWDVVSW